jgi:serine/threonine protein kinase
LLDEGGRGYVFVAHDPDLNVDVVLKMILLGPKESVTRISRQEMIDKEIKIGLVVAKESRFLVSYTEVFEWRDCFCIKMEYCILGDLQHQFDVGKIFTEEV